jgi:hypothetical protein
MPHVPYSQFPEAEAIRIERKFGGVGRGGAGGDQSADRSPMQKPSPARGQAGAWAPFRRTAEQTACRIRPTCS